MLDGDFQRFCPAAQNKIAGLSGLTAQQFTHFAEYFLNLAALKKNGCVIRDHFVVHSPHLIRNKT